MISTFTAFLWLSTPGKPIKGSLSNALIVLWAALLSCLIVYSNPLSWKLVARMSFGFSVGDFLAVGRLIYDITNALRGSKVEYQELVRELERYN